MTTINLVPKHAFFIAGTGTHRDRLQAFDQALLSAGPLAHNLVAVSSIMPAGCTVISPEEGFKMLTAGQITFCIMARQDTNQRNAFASAAVGLVKVKDPTKFGYISEYHGDASGKQEAETIAKRLAVEMFETKTGIPIKDNDVDVIHATTASIQQPGDNSWVSAVSLCIFIL
ncbi:pyruvoyl-dependent arginine decarboxylase [Candidatus Kaiserbacteria bacterium]|nr:pyruvoyl-dependent arginine decarboxylase [Candidatus Kaiserbacteria bacterium]